MTVVGASAVGAPEAGVGARIAVLPGGVLAPAGFRAGAGSAGLRERSAADDVALIVADEPASAAGFFTRRISLPEVGNVRISELMRIAPMPNFGITPSIDFSA